MIFCSYVNCRYDQLQDLRIGRLCKQDCTHLPCYAYRRIQLLETSGSWTFMSGGMAEMARRVTSANFNFQRSLVFLHVTTVYRSNRIGRVNLMR